MHLCIELNDSRVNQTGHDAIDWQCVMVDIATNYAGCSLVFVELNFHFTKVELETC